MPSLGVVNGKREAVCSKCHKPMLLEQNFYTTKRKDVYENGYVDENGLHNTYLNDILKKYGYYPVYLLLPRYKLTIANVLKSLPNEKQLEITDTVESFDKWIEENL